MRTHLNRLRVCVTVVVALVAMLMLVGTSLTAARHDDGLTPVVPWHHPEGITVEVGEAIDVGSRYGACTNKQVKQAAKQLDVVVEVDGVTLPAAGWSRPVRPEQRIASTDFRRDCARKPDSRTGSWVFWNAPVVFDEPGTHTVRVTMTADKRVTDGVGEVLPAGWSLSEEIAVEVVAPPEEPGDPTATTLATPEDAVREYLAGFADADIERMLAASAVDPIAEGFRFDLFIDRIGAFAPHSRIAPAEYPFFADIARTLRASDLLFQARNLAYSLLSETPIGPESIIGADLEPDPLRWAQQFIEQVDPARLSALEVIDVAPPDSEFIDSDRHLELLARTAAHQGADELTERVATISFEGEPYRIGFTLLRYGEEWGVAQQVAILGETDPMGFATPLEDGDSQPEAEPISMDAALFEFDSLYGAEMASSDARATGSHTSELYSIDNQEFEVESLGMRITNDRGRWAGTGLGVWLYGDAWPSAERFVAVVELLGEDGYDGLAMDLIRSADGRHYGVIYPADQRPAYPDLPEGSEAAEGELSSREWAAFTATFGGDTFGATDPRIAGSITFELGESAQEDFTLQANSMRIENEGGAWTGTGRGVIVPDKNEADDLTALFQLEGEGGYEGLSANVIFAFDEDPWGVIYTSGALAQAPAPPRD